MYCQLEWGVYVSSGYMCILLYVTLIWYNVIPYIYCQLVWVRWWDDVSSVYMCILLICDILFGITWYSIGVL